MADPLLHIKDSYYFEVPKVLAPSHRAEKSDFPEVWVRLDDQYQDWEADRILHDLGTLPTDVRFPAPTADTLHHEYQHWLHADHANHGKPFDVYVEETSAKLLADFHKAEPGKAQDGAALANFLRKSESPVSWFAVKQNDQDFLAKWERVKAKASDVQAFCGDSNVAWSAEKIQAYNYHLSGKILIPQPFGTLRNYYEKESGWCISKYMILEVVAGLIIVALFARLASRVKNGAPAKGPLANMLEAILLYIRDGVARPAIGGHHDDHGHDEHAEHGHAEHAADGHAAQAHAAKDDGHGHAAHAHAAKATVNENPADAFVPLLWTIFFFVLICNLLGMVPYLGAPTSSWGVTVAMAAVTLTTVVAAGMKQFGFVGFFTNQVPSMDLPWFMSPLKVVIFVIEMLGLCIKHAVLSVRLLANMVAGHLVILGIFGIALASVGHWSWNIAGPIAIAGVTLFSVLELFVAFLQAYVFTFLTALFIGAAVHKH